MKTLLEKLEMAEHNKEINSPFTTKDLRQWIKNHGILNDKTGLGYKVFYM